jgi:hypothetical protein
MISEKEFAVGFAGFWSECLPFLTPQVVAEFNVIGTALTEGRREWVKPLAGSGDNSNNDVVAETAFGLFAASLKEGKDVLTLARDMAMIKAIGDSAIERILGLRGYWMAKRRQIDSPTDEAIELAKRLEDYFSAQPSEQLIVVQPQFKGCGILNSCYGDLHAAKCLYELKMVERNLRSADLRQVLIYCALNYRSQQYNIESVVVLNPRRGIEFRFAVEELAARAARKTSGELFHEITEFLCNFETAHQAS